MTVFLRKLAEASDMVPFFLPCWPIRVSSSNPILGKSEPPSALEETRQVLPRDLRDKRTNGV